MLHLVQRANIDMRYQIASAATSWEEIGNPIYPPAAAKLTEKGIRYSAAKRAQPLDSKFYNKYDLLICMDGENVYNTRQFFGGDLEDKIHLLLDYTSSPGREVADPGIAAILKRLFRILWRVARGCFVIWRAGSRRSRKRRPRRRSPRPNRCHVGRAIELNKLK